MATKRRRPSKGNLPARSPRSFVGRAGDVTGISERLEDARVVTITGPGGIGKTTLALQVAAANLVSYSSHQGGGVWLCDLTEAENGAGIIAAVAGVLGIGLRVDGGGRDASGAETVGRALARRGRILLVLDNFDRITEFAEETVGVWLRASQGARFLVTSRAPLALGEEQLWALEPLPAQDAEELFLRRARKVRPVELAEELEAVPTIVEVVDRIPLAIELAASRVAVLSTLQIKDRLQNSLELLNADGRKGRHASMRSAVRDSVASLSEDCVKVFFGCAAMRNGFTLDAAESILGGVVAPRSEILQHLDVLVRRSLLRTQLVPGEGATRFSYFGAIREVAEGLLESAPEIGDALIERHVLTYANLATALGRAAALRTMGPEARTLAHDLENMLLAHKSALIRAHVERGDNPERSGARFAKAATELAMGLEPLLSARGLLRLRAELADSSVTALEAAAAEPEEMRIEALLLRGSARLELGELEGAKTDFVESAKLAQKLGLLEAQARALSRLGEIVDILGDTHAARGHFRDALALLDGLGDGADRTDSPQREGQRRVLHYADTLVRIGHAHRREGELIEAREEIHAAIERYRALGHDEGLTNALYEAAVVAMFREDAAEASSLFEEGLRVAQRANVPLAAASLKTARGCLLQDAGRLDEAVEHHAEAKRIFQELGNRYREASALYYLSTAYLERGAPKDAISTLRQVLELLRGGTPPRYEALTYGCLATTLGMLGELTSARDALLHAERAAALVRDEAALLANVQMHRLSHEILSNPARSKAAALEEARRLVTAHSNDDSRFAFRMVRTLARPPAADDARENALTIWDDGRGFRMPGAPPVELPPSSPLCRILALLATRRVDAVGEAIPIEDLIRAGWPTEKIGATSALNRAYVALATLRKLGLRSVLLHRSGGYLLTEAVTVSWLPLEASSSSPSR